MLQDNKSVVERAVIYARVSTGMQINGTSIEGQLDEVRAWAAKNGFEIVGEYTDEGESGRSTANRTNFKRMIMEIGSMQATAILCWKHSRLFRCLEDAIMHKHLLLREGVRLISVSEPIEDGPVGRLIEHILMAINEFYSANVAEDSLRGLCELARQGYLTGPALYGYDSITVQNSKGYMKRKAIINESEAHVVRLIYKWRAQGASLKTIPERLNEMGVPSPRSGKWQSSTIYNILFMFQEKYLGTLIYNRRGHKGVLNDMAKIKPRSEWVIVPGGLPPIITQDMAEAVNKIRDLRRMPRQK